MQLPTMGQNYTMERGTLVIKPEYKDESFEYIMEKEDLAFPVYAVDTYYTSPFSPDKLIASASKSIIRGDNDMELGYGMSKDYTPVSYMEAVYDIFQDTKKLGGIPTRAVNFKNGRKMALQFMLPEDYFVAGKLHKQFFNIYAAHDGTMGIAVNSSDICIVCGNTFRYSLKDKTLKNNARHTPGVHNKLSAIGEAILTVNGEAKKYYAEMEKMAQIKAGQEFLNNFMDVMYPKVEGGNKAKDNQRAEFISAVNISRDERNSSEVTIYDVFSGVTRYSSYKIQRRNSEEQFEYVNTGPGARFNTQALETIRELIG